MIVSGIDIGTEQQGGVVENISLSLIVLNDEVEANQLKREKQKH